MKFVCERCHTKYSIADEKVRGKVLKVRCKTCENVITVRESGATIDEPITAGPKDLPVVRSGTLEGAARGAGAARGPAARRGAGGGGGGGPAGAAVATATAARRPMPAAAFSDPLAPAEAPPPPRRRAPTPPPGTALPVVADDGLDWYLAVDGAQTGPFDRPTLIEKILAVPPDGDIHVWNAGLGSWKPPQDVPDVEADVVRMRRAAEVIPPVPSSRRSGEAVPAPAGRGAAMPAASHHPGGTNGVALGDQHGGAKGHAQEKSNGVGPSAPAGVAAQGARSGFGLEALFNEPSAGTSAPEASQAQTVAATMLGALPSATMSSSAGVAPSPAASIGAALARPGRQTKLIIGAVALAAIVCTIVAVALLRKPSAVSVAPPPSRAGTGEPAVRPPAPEPTPVAPPLPATTPAPEPTPIAKVEGKPEGRPEAGSKGGRGKGRRRGASGTSPTAPPPIGGMTTEQMQAANRFGEATPRDIRAAAAASPSARSTPAQADISRVISNNRQGIQTCYQRALLRDNTLTQGKVTVRVSIGISGRVKSVNLDAPPQFRSMESCVRDVMSRWAFPPSSEEYGTEFPVVLQGNQ
jgi:predicted Zn finger-like uncharacterized protein